MALENGQNVRDVARMIAISAAGFYIGALIGEGIRSQGFVPQGSSILNGENYRISKMDDDLLEVRDTGNPSNPANVLAAMEIIKNRADCNLGQSIQPTPERWIVYMRDPEQCMGALKAIAQSK